MTVEVKSTNEELVLRYQKGDLLAVEELTRRFHPLIAKYGYSPYLWPNREEIMQVLWLAFLEAAKKYDPTKCPYFPSYIKNHVIWAKKMYLRGCRTYGKKEGTPLSWNSEDTYEVDLSHLEREEIRAALKNLHLPSKQEQILFLIMDGKKTKEIMRELHISQQAIYKTKQKAFAKCRDALRSFQ